MGRKARREGLYALWTDLSASQARNRDFICRKRKAIERFRDENDALRRPAYSSRMWKNEKAIGASQERGDPRVNKGGVRRKRQVEEHAGLTTCRFTLNSTLMESTWEGREGSKMTLALQAPGKRTVPLKKTGMRKAEAR